MQIEDPTNYNTKPDQSQTQNTAIGIDLGTTNSLVCISDLGTFKTVVDLTKSVVLFTNLNETIVGNEAFEKMQNHPSNLKQTLHIGSCQVVYGYETSLKEEPVFVAVKSVKSIMGRDDVLPKIFGKHYTPVDISKLILEHLKKSATVLLGFEPTKAVISVPAYFDDNQRSATKQAAQQAGLEILRLINEPTAAALAYGIDHQSEGLYAVFDLGGGTFDVSVLKMQMGVFKVIATGGDTMLGGDNFDRAISKYFNISFADGCYIKEYLSDHKSINQKFVDITTLELKQINLSRDEFDKIVLEIIHQIVDIFKSTLKDANIDSNFLDGIILVGGATRMPIIKEAIDYELTDKIFQDLDPDRIVAFGSAIQAENLTCKNINTLLLDVIPLSLGIELMGGSVQKIIYRNTQIPFLGYQSFTTYEDNQNAIEINIVQGERDLASDCRNLGRFTLSGIPALPAGVPDVKISFFIDADGILTVSAKEQLTGIEQSIEIKPTYGIDYDDITTMIETSMQNAKNDIQLKLDIDQKVEARGVIKKIQSQMQRNKHLLNANQEGKIKAVITALQNVLNHNQDEPFNRSLAGELTKQLNQVATPFIQNILENSITTTLKDSNVNEIS